MKGRTETYRFGGAWTRLKLANLFKYLQAWRKIFDKNEQAKWFQTEYVDAFAGAGSWSDSGDVPGLAPTLFDDVPPYAADGSASLALKIEPPFHRYLFIESSLKRYRSLLRLRNSEPGLADRIQVERGDANRILTDWCESRDWKRTRAVVFLDPHGAEVLWSTVAALAQTGGVDLWYLFPAGIGISRMLPHTGPPKDEWARKLTALLGTEGWREVFYQERACEGLFGPQSELERTADPQRIMDFIVARLKTVFVEVAPPKVLRNSNNSPMYLLCFAASNARGAPTAVRIARDLLEK